MHKNITPDNPVCLSCEEFMPYLSFIIRDFMVWVWKNHSNIHICQGFRNQENQHKAFLEGKSKLEWPKSKHNHMKDGQPFSLAVDLFVLDEHGMAQFPDSFYQDLNEEIILSSQPIKWGGNFPHFHDADHFEVEV